jgi:dienelactone hydrolase
LDLNLHVTRRRPVEESQPKTAVSFCPLCPTFQAKKLLAQFVAAGLAMLSSSTVVAAGWVPPGLPAPPAKGPVLCQGNYLKPEEGRAVLDYALTVCSNRASWEAYANTVRAGILHGAGLDPLPRRTPLHPIFGSPRVHDGYTVENVAFESIPGFFVAGNLYRPLGAKPPYAVMLSTHGHGNVPADTNNFDGPLFSAGMQQRCATLARLGAVVFSVDMFGYGQSRLQVPVEAHLTPTAMKIQLWDNLRAIDFLLSLPDVDPARVGVSGESGGGTQTFMLTAVEPRVTLSVPVVMVSSYFFGGCACESGRPIHRTADYFADNAEIAALAAPRPMLVVSDGADWTQNVPAVEFPFLQRVYSYYGATGNVANIHLAAEGHDYGPSKRDAMYRFVADRFKLSLASVQIAAGGIDESKVTVESWQTLCLFDHFHPLPANALHGVDAIEAEMSELQKR